MTKSAIPFRFSPETLIRLELEVTRETTRLSKPRDLASEVNKDSTSGEGILNWAAYLVKQRGGPLYDSNLVAEIKKMSIQDVLLAAHQYLPGEVFQD